MSIKFVKSFSKGQITIPKELREELGISDDFWLKLSVHDGKIVAEPVSVVVNRSAYQKKLLKIKGGWISNQDLLKSRKQVEQQVASRLL